jgi:uncharacterized protein YndB with AHSA1/START domain
MDTSPHIDIRVAQHLNARADRVFNAWLDPDVAGKWLFATAWRPMSRVEIDARKGGSFCLADGKGAEYTGVYMEVVPPRRLVFTLSMENRPKVVTRVIAEIVPLKAGCELRLVHENVPAVHLSRVENRWTGMLYGLGETLKKASIDGARPAPARSRD